MFICKKCGQVPEKIKEQKIVTKIRTVKYLFRNIYITTKMDNEKGISIHTRSEPKVVKETAGWEIVEQGIYCPKCAPKDSKPEIIGTVNRYTDRTVYVRDKKKKGLFSRGRR